MKLREALARDWPIMFAVAALISMLSHRPNTWLGPVAFVGTIIGWCIGYKLRR